MKLKVVAGSMFVMAMLASQAPAQAHYRSHRHAHAHGSAYSGYASWYGPGFQGRRTASGEVFNTNGLTAAHRFLPLGCSVRVTNRANGRSVVVRINDRGPFGTGKVIDLSRASAHAIGMNGSAPVSIAPL